MNKEMQNEVLDIFKKNFQFIDNNSTVGWKFKKSLLSNKVFYIQCRNGTRNNIDVKSSEKALTEWNDKYPKFKLKEVDRYSIEDDEVWTWIIWQLEIT